jgi:DNA-binding transcriptional regulator GbsR (MarR family)
MSNDEKQEYKGIVRRELLIPGISLAFAIIGFYFKTNMAIDTMQTELSEVKAELHSKANASDMNEKIHSIHQDIRDVQNSNQKILEILLEKQP